jgi:hypothetical protein
VQRYLDAARPALVGKKTGGEIFLSVRGRKLTNQRIWQLLVAMGKRAGLGPKAIVTPDVCAGCDFNAPESRCKRPMDWRWRGEPVLRDASAVAEIRRQLDAYFARRRRDFDPGLEVFGIGQLARVIDQGLDAAASRVPLHDDVAHLQDLHREFDHGTDRSWPRI